MIRVGATRALCTPAQLRRAAPASPRRRTPPYGSRSTARAWWTRWSGASSCSPTCMATRTPTTRTGRSESRATLQVDSLSPIPSPRLFVLSARIRCARRRLHKSAVRAHSPCTSVISIPPWSHLNPTWRAAGGGRAQLRAVREHPAGQVQAGGGADLGGLEAFQAARRSQAVSRPLPKDAGRPGLLTNIAQRTKLCTQLARRYKLGHQK